jgi:hypothetical protein
MKDKSTDENLRIIRFKPSDAAEFKNYIDIGSTEREYYYIDYSHSRLIREEYNSWFDYFRQEPIGSKMIIINYYLTIFMGWDTNENIPQLDHFRDVYGEEFCNTINSNLPLLLEFNGRWFEDETWFFKGLDFTLDMNEVESTTLNDEDYTTDVRFTDGSAISFLDDDDQLNSFFVPEESYSELKNEMDNIVSLFKPFNSLEV